MKLAGRWRPGWYWIPCASKTDAISSSASSSAPVTSMVFAPYWLDIVRSTPGRPWISASPTFGADPSTTCATSLSRTIGPFWPATTTSPSCAAVRMGVSD